LSAGEPTESVRYPRYEVVTQFLYYVYYPFAREYRQHLFGGETLRRMATRPLLLHGRPRRANSCAPFWPRRHAGPNSRSEVKKRELWFEVRSLISVALGRLDLRSFGH
jgi:hypothetical protein